MTKIGQNSHQSIKNCLMWTKVTQKGQNSPQIAKNNQIITDFQTDFYSDSVEHTVQHTSVTAKQIFG